MRVGYLLRRLWILDGSSGADAEIRDDGEIANGHPIQSGYLAIANREAELMIRIASEICFTPAVAGYWHRRPTNFRFLI
jgi:hypothetical protein